MLPSAPSMSQLTTRGHAKERPSASERVRGSCCASEEYFSASEEYFCASEDLYFEFEPYSSES